MSFSGVSFGNYYIAVRHRNHLAIISNTEINPLDYTSAAPFTFDNSDTYGTNAMVDLGDGNYGMWDGDANNDGSITNADKSPINSTKVFVGYDVSDLNFDGSVTNADKSVVNTNKVTTPQTYVPNP